MSKITVGTYYITERTNRERWKLVVRSTDYGTGFAQCDWDNMSTGFKLHGRTDSLHGLNEFYDNNDWIIEREPELPEELFTL